MRKNIETIILVLGVLAIFSLGCKMLGGKGGIVNKGTEPKEAISLAQTKLKEKKGFIVSTKQETIKNNVKDKNVFLTVTHYVAPDKEFKNNFTAPMGSPDEKKLAKEEIKNGNVSLSCTYIPADGCKQCCTETKNDKPYSIWDSLILRTSFDTAVNKFTFKSEESLNGKDAIVYKTGDDKEGKEVWLSRETALPLQVIDFRSYQDEVNVNTSTFDYETTPKIPNYK